MATAPVETLRRVDAGVPPLRHLADHMTGHRFALCGHRRDRPLMPGSPPEHLCVVCADLYAQRHGRPY